TTSTPSEASSSTNASCCLSRSSRSGGRQAAAEKSPPCAGEPTSTRRSGTVIERTPYAAATVIARIQAGKEPDGQGCHEPRRPPLVRTKPGNQVALQPGCVGSS